MAAAIVELEPDGSYIPEKGSPHRKMTKEEVQDAQAAARKSRPSFKGPHNAKWDDHHPVMREVWENLSHTPAVVAPEDKERIAALEAEIAALKA